MLDLRNFEVLTFDCYGTLIDWESGILSALRPFRDANGLDASDGELLETYARVEAHIQRSHYRPYRDVLRSVMKDIAVHYGVPVGSFDEDAIAKSLPSWPAFPDTNGALATLGSYYRLGVISNIDEDLFAASSRHLNAGFDWVITAQQVGAYKPAFKMFRTARDVIGVHPSRILHVAQSLFHDIRPAESLDWHTCWVNRRHVATGSATHPASAEPDLVVPDLETLAELVTEHLGPPPARDVEEHFYI